MVASHTVLGYMPTAPPRPQTCTSHPVGVGCPIRPATHRRASSIEREPLCHLRDQLCLLGRTQPRRPPQPWRRIYKGASSSRQDRASHCCTLR
jgi:hypothetical protein